MRWKYGWESDRPELWSSGYSFDSHWKAKVSALNHAHNAKRRKGRIDITGDNPKNIERLWRSLRVHGGWKIRRKKIDEA